MNFLKFNLLYSDIFAGSTTVGLGQKLLSLKFPPVKAQGMKRKGHHVSGVSLQEQESLFYVPK